MGDQTRQLVEALESVAHFAPGRVGVIARDALVEAGVWVETVECDERPHLTDYWLERTAAFTPGHDLPCRQGLMWSLATGTVTWDVA